jgi:hypothetical protein
MEKPIVGLMPPEKKGKTRMKTKTSNIGKALTMVGIAAVLGLGLETSVRAQANVIKGELVLPGGLPFYTMPGDPFVDVFGDFLVEVLYVEDRSGGLHILVRESKETLSSTVIGTNFDYELVSVEVQSPNNINAQGHYAGSVRQKITLLRISRATSLPIALVTGEGIGYTVIGADGTLVVAAENMKWTITPL